ncbi:MAG: (d)CMP kinase [Planctomycetaceae bacterium]|jgi:cytidylate kinase|nr:(d)CMP kinase [Planctomycetaceae bacterium]
MIITIDGPAGVGKSTVAKAAARQLGLDYLDTGAMYRAVAFFGLQEKMDWNDPAKLTELAKSLVFHTEAGRTMVNGFDVTDRIRTSEVTNHTHYAADNPQIREILVKAQQETARNHPNLVTEGRDQGSAVFPNAELKFFLTASLEERTRRRMEEYRRKGETGLNERQIFEQIKLRDERDSQREVGPLRKPDSAIEIVTDNMSIDEVTAKIVTHIRIGQQKKENHFPR